MLTIIILLLLSGISINMISGQDGILNKALDAKTKMNNEEKLEKIKLAMTSASLNEQNKIDKEILEKELRPIF